MIHIFQNPQAAAAFKAGVEFANDGALEADLSADRRVLITTDAADDPDGTGPVEVRDYSDESSYFVPLHGAILRIRCAKHTRIPQLNSTEHEGGECGACIHEKLRALALDMAALADEFPSEFATRIRNTLIDHNV